eukprot:1423273-Rhodomonas_salina.1
MPRQHQSQLQRLRDNSVVVDVAEQEADEPRRRTACHAQRKVRRRTAHLAGKKSPRCVLGRSQELLQNRATHVFCVRSGTLLCVCQ